MSRTIYVCEQNVENLRKFDRTRCARLSTGLHISNVNIYKEWVKHILSLTFSLATHSLFPRQLTSNLPLL